jgi:hypothetical protein
MLRRVCGAFSAGAGLRDVLVQRASVPPRLRHRSACLKAVAPSRTDLVVCVACLFTWYWLADLCAREGMPFVLGHALSMKAMHGGKALLAESGHRGTHATWCPRPHHAGRQRLPTAGATSERRREAVNGTPWGDPGYPVRPGARQRMPWSLDGLCPHPRIGRNNLLSAKTRHGVIVHHPRGLHICIAHRGAHELKLALAQILTHRL